MLEQFQQNIQNKALFKKDDKVLLAVSGGIDSMVLSHLFKVSGYNFAIAHCNFQLRNEASEEDHLLVKNWAEKNNIEFFEQKFDTANYANQQGISIQMAARELRYNWFFQLLEQHGFDYLATAHHHNDSVETFFINIIRGTGIAGLHGIMEKKEKLIRPLTAFSKNEIHDFAVANQIPWREDESNASDKYLRNKVRLHLIPLLKEINPEIEKVTGNNIEHFKAWENSFEKILKTIEPHVLTENGSGISIPFSVISNYGLDELSLAFYLKKFGFNYSQSSNIFKAISLEVGKQFYSENFTLLVDRHSLQIEAKIEKKEEVYFITEKQSEINSPIHLKLNGVETFDKSLNSKNLIQLDADLLTFPLKLRQWQPGDYFHPFGMKGKQKLSDFFINQKLSLFEKQKIWLLESNNEIVWVIGYRMSEKFKINEKIRNILRIEYLTQITQSY